MRKRAKSSCEIVSNSCPDYHVRAATVIRAGGIVAIPTETYYGLAVDPFNEPALERLFSVKMRPKNKPVLVLIDHVAQLSRLVRSIPPRFYPLLESFWPGPLTLIFPAKKELSPLITGGTDTIGVRISSCEAATRICQAFSGPITATSANISAEKPSTSPAAISRSLGNKLDLIIDGGVTPGEKCSTIVSVEKGKLILLRDGEISFSKLLAAGH